MPTFWGQVVQFSGATQVARIGEKYRWTGAFRRTEALGSSAFSFTLSAADSRVTRLVWKQIGPDNTNDLGATIVPVMQTDYGIIVEFKPRPEDGPGLHGLSFSISASGNFDPATMSWSWVNGPVNAGDSTPNYNFSGLGGNSGSSITISAPKLNVTPFVMAETSILVRRDYAARAPTRIAVQNYFAGGQTRVRVGKPRATSSFTRIRVGTIEDMLAATLVRVGRGRTIRAETIVRSRNFFLKAAVKVHIGSRTAARAAMFVRSRGDVG